MLFKVWYIKVSQTSTVLQGLHKLSDWVSAKKVDFRKDVEGEEQFGK